MSILLSFFSKIVNTGIDDQVGIAEARRIKLLNKISLAVAITVALYIPVITVLGISPYFVAYAALSSVLASLGIVLNSMKRYTAAKVWFVAFSALSTCTSSILLGKEIEVQYMLVAGSLIPLVIFDDLRLAISLAFTIFVLYCLTTFLQGQIAPIIYIPPYLVTLGKFIMVFSAFLLVFLILMYFWMDNKQFEEKLHTQNLKIEEKNKEITDSISYAKRIQEAILPPGRLVQQHLPGSFILYKPKDIVAGDFYWLEEVNDKLLFAVADCTGHGVPGAMVSVVCSNALNRAVKEFDITDPGRILDKVTVQVMETFAKSENEMKDGMDISLLCIDKRTNAVTWAGANNPLWVVRSDSSLFEQKADKQPVGKFDHARPFTTHSIPVSKGDVIYLFTDGLADQFGGPKGKKFKYSQLKELLVSVSSKTADEQRKVIDDIFEAWRGDLEQVDDVCVAGVRV